MLVEVSAGFCPPRLDLKPFSLGLAVKNTLFRRAFRIAFARGAFADSPKVDDVPHPAGLDGSRITLWAVTPICVNYADTMAADQCAIAAQRPTTILTHYYDAVVIEKSAIHA